MGDANRESVEYRSKFAVKKAQSLRLRKQELIQRHESVGAIEELIQCGICLERLTDPRMLPCQHTFCLTCLQSYLLAQKVLLKNQTAEDSINVLKGPHILRCPVCQTESNLVNGADSLQDLPKNLYVDSILKVMVGNVSPVAIQTDSRCDKCHISIQQQEQCCQHCMQMFCKVCWNGHMSELESNLSVLIKQLDESAIKLDHRLESFENRCDHLTESIKEVTLKKINSIKLDEAKVLSEVETIVAERGVNCDNIKKKLQGLRKKLSSMSFANNPSKVFSFMSLHKETSELLSMVRHFGEERYIFDPEFFKLDKDTEGIYSDPIDHDTSAASNSFEVISHHYKNRLFVPKLVWKKCPRPASVAVPPWNNGLIYIAATDTHTVLILNKDRRKLEGRLTSPDILYPQGLAFSKTYEEIFVSDKWKHCIHVFSKKGQYLRCMLSKGNGVGKVSSPDGLAIGPNEELIISDSGNDRIVVINPRTGEHISTIGAVKNKTTLNMPTGVAVNGEKIFIADTGNHRIKVFDLGGRYLQQFGSLGRGRGQFRSAEVIAVDRLGFILVGDGGNARIQVFAADGSVVKIFGGSSTNSEGFGWVSGIFVTSELEIIAADSRKRCLTIF